MLEDLFDAEGCLGRLHEIYRRDRWCRYSSFAQTAEYCREQMQEAGLCQVESLAVPADGSSPCGDWVVPRAWDAHAARLQVAPAGPILADYEENPCALVMYSAATTPEGLEAGVAIVDTLDTADPAEMSGKLLLTSLPPQALVSLAVQARCPGILSDHMPLYPGVRNSRDDVWEATRWDNTFCIPANGTGLFAFSLSPRMGDMLRGMLCENSALRLHACVDARFFGGECRTVSGCIPGTGPNPGENLAYAHLYEPGAHDNASGAAMLLELARCIADAVRTGSLPPPRHTLRFALGWECAGSAAYCLAHPDRVAASVGGFVADMVGAGEEERAVLALWHNPLSNYSVCDVLMRDILSAYHGRQDVPWREKPFAIATDNVLGDPCWHMPTVALMAEPALGYHSSVDTPSCIHSGTLLRNGVAAGAYLLTLAAGDAGWAARMWPRVAQQAAAYQQAAAPGQASAALLAEMRRAAANSLARLCPGWTPPAQDAAVFPPPPAMLAEQAGRVYRRTVPGCLTLQGKPQLSDARWQPAWNTALHRPLFWADGSRTLWQATVLAAAEAGGCSENGLAALLKENAEFFHFLEGNGFLARCQY